jgi:hypothetical protein
MPAYPIPTSYMSHICPTYIPHISHIYIEAGYIRDISGLYPGNTCLCHAFGMPYPLSWKEVDRDYLNIKTQPLWQDKRQALVSQAVFTTFLLTKEGI